MHQVGTTNLGAWWVVVPTWPPTLISLAHVTTYLQEKITIALSLSRVLALKPVDFNLFARSSVSDTVLGDCYLVCDSSIGPISFCFSGLYFE